MLAARLGSYGHDVHFCYCLDVSLSPPTILSRKPILANRVYRQVPYAITGPPGVRLLLIVRGMSGCVILAEIPVKSSKYIYALDSLVSSPSTIASNTFPCRTQPCSLFSHRLLQHLPDTCYSGNRSLREKRSLGVRHFFTNDPPRTNDVLHKWYPLWV